MEYPPAPPVTLTNTVSFFFFLFLFLLLAIDNVPRCVQVKGRRTNAALVRNALKFNSLAGSTMAMDLSRGLDAIKMYPHSNFTILMRKAKNLAFSGLYRVDFELRLFFLIYGHGPEVVEEEMVKDFYKYDSALKHFIRLKVSGITPTTDGIGLKDKYDVVSLWVRIDPFPKVTREKSSGQFEVVCLLLQNVLMMLNCS